MGEQVFVWPLDILAGIYASLMTGSTTKGGFSIKELPKDADSAPGEKLAILFNVESKLSPSGQISLEATGQRKQGILAEITAITSLLESLRSQYGIFPADYSYVIISEKRALYSEMTASMQALKMTYAAIEGIVDDCCDALYVCRQQPSDWVTMAHSSTNLTTMTEVSGFTDWLAAYAYTMSSKKTEAGGVIRMMSSRDAMLESLERLFNSTAMPMKISWEASFQVLQTLLKAAATHIGIELSKIEVNQVGGVGYKAAIAVPFEPKQFTGPTARDPEAAKAKLVYVVLKHMKMSMGLSVVDMHWEGVQHMEEFIVRFDSSMETIWQCGNRQALVARDCVAELCTKSACLIGARATYDHRELLKQIIKKCKERITAALAELDIEQANLMRRKVDKAFLEHWIERTDYA